MEIATLALFFLSTVANSTATPFTAVNQVPTIDIRLYVNIPPNAVANQSNEKHVWASITLTRPWYSHIL